MPLDLAEISARLEQLAQGLGQSKSDREKRLQTLLDNASKASPDSIEKATGSLRERPGLAAVVEGELLGSHPSPEPITDWRVAAVDGSHIDVDRHLPVACFLVNYGGCTLTYGTNPDAAFFAQPHLATQPSDLNIADPGNPSQEEPVTGPLLGLIRTVGELEKLGQVVGELSPDLPILALIDGSLVLWGLSGQGYRPFVRDAIIRDRLLPALENMRLMAKERPLALAAYVSLPRSTEVVNAVRGCLCPHALSQCHQACGPRRSSLSPCDLADGFLDRDLFQTLLAPGWRSPVYRTDSSVPREFYGENQQVYFYYLNGGEEIGRVEIPRWVAEDESLLSLSHGLLLRPMPAGTRVPGGHLRVPRAGGNQHLRPPSVQTNGVRRPGPPGSGCLHLGKRPL